MGPSWRDAPDAPETPQFSQQDPRVVQRQPGMDVSPDRRPDSLGTWAGVRATPGDWDEQWYPTNQSAGVNQFIDRAVGFQAHTIFVDNWTNQWLYIDTCRRFIPPYSGGWIIPVHSGSQKLTVKLQAPAFSSNPAAIAGEYCWIGLAEAYLAAATGGSTIGSTVATGDADASANFTGGTAVPTIGHTYIFNGTTWDRWREAPSAGGVASSNVGIGSSGLLFYDSGNATWRSWGGNGGDGLPSYFNPYVTPTLFNETTLDRQRGNTNITLLASASRTVTTLSPQITNINAKGVFVVINVTVAGTSTISCRLLGYDTIIANNTFLTPTLPISGLGQWAFEAYPGASTISGAGAGNTILVHSIAIPRYWGCYVVSGDASAWTYSVTASPIL